MNDSESKEPGSRPTDRSRQTELQCIGSFRAHTQDGEAYTIEIWTAFGAVHDRDQSRVAPGMMILTTTEGRDVVRVTRGEYRLHDNPEISLSSNDPDAP